MLLEGQVAVVTGAAVGIGRGMAVAFAEEGADIALLDIDAVNNLEAAEAVRALGRRALAIDCDVADKVQVRKAFARVINELGRVDILVNNAAVWLDTSLTAGTFDTQSTNYERSIDICAMGSYYCALAAVPAMRKAGGGHIINIITEHIKEGHYITGMYATGYDGAKFVQWRQTESWAVELKPHGIRVNAICPGATDTPMLRNFSPAMADIGMKPADVALAALNIIRQGPDGPVGKSYLVGPSRSGTGRADAEAILHVKE